MDDRELPFLFHGKSADFQDDGAGRDHSGSSTRRGSPSASTCIDLASGAWVARPLTPSTLLLGLAQEPRLRYGTSPRLGSRRRRARVRGRGRGAREDED
jgi:hypothetical protein